MKWSDEEKMYLTTSYIEEYDDASTINDQTEDGRHLVGESLSQNFTWRVGARRWESLRVSPFRRAAPFADGQIGENIFLFKFQNSLYDYYYTTTSRGSIYLYGRPDDDK
jgi:hypothetical protein